MANPNAPHGMQPVGYTNGAPWTGKANLYHIQSTDTIAYYIGDIMQLVPNAGANSSTKGSDALGVPNVTGYAIGTPVTAAIPVGVVIAMMVAPIGVGTPGAGQGQAVNLNVSYIPATKLNDYYVLIADDPNLEFEIQMDSNAGGTSANIVGLNAGFSPTAPATVQGPVSGTITTFASFNTTNTLPLKIVRLPYRPNITPFGPFCPLIVRWNTHQYTVATGTLGQ